jgi:hypothetical protein
MLPEFTELLSMLPSGTMLLGSHKAHTATTTKALDLSARLSNIVESLPAPMKNAFAPVIHSRQAAVKEACGIMPDARNLTHEGAELQSLRAGTITAKSNEEAAVFCARAMVSEPPSLEETTGKGTQLFSPLTMKTHLTWLRKMALGCLMVHDQKNLMAFPNVGSNVAEKADGMFSVADDGVLVGLKQVEGLSVVASVLKVDLDPKLVPALKGAVIAAGSSVCRNMAAFHTQRAISLLKDAGNVNSSANAAVGSLNTAEQLITLALNRINEQLDEARYLKFEKPSSNSAAAAHVDDFLRSVGNDLSYHAAHLEASLAEITLLSALWSAWSDPQASVHKHEDKEGGTKNGDGGEINSKSVKPASILLLSNEQQQTLSTPMKQASEHAEASLKRLSQLVPADGSVTSLRFSDYGLDFSGGMARPLRILALLQLLGRRPVMAEGFLRAAVDHHENDLILRNAQGQRISSNNGAYDLYPRQLQGTIGLTNFIFGHLLLSWEKRESEGNKMLDTSKQLLTRFDDVMRGTNGSTFAANEDARRTFIKGMLLGSAAGSMHVGSTSLALEEALEDIRLA